MASIVEKICQTLCSEVHRPESLECTFNNRGQRHLETGVCCSKERDDGLQGLQKTEEMEILLLRVLSPLA
jgi:hypothetical protein